MEYHDKIKFSTKDADNDLDATQNCASKYNSGWWFNSCYKANLNGLYNNQSHGVRWNPWQNSGSLTQSEIKIRPIFY